MSVAYDGVFPFDFPDRRKTDRRDCLVKLELPGRGYEAGETGQVFRKSMGLELVGWISEAHPRVTGMLVG